MPHHEAFFMISGTARLHDDSYNNGVEMPDNQSIAKRRGVDPSLDHLPIDFIAIFVLAPIEQVSPVVSHMPYAMTFIADVYGKTIENTWGVMFQYHGHPWTICMVGHTAHMARKLSQRLQTKSIFFQFEDTGGWFDYQLFQNGEAIEELSCDEYIYDDQHKHLVLIPEPYNDDSGGFGLKLDGQWVAMFRSRLRTISAHELARSDLFNTLLLAQDAWMPEEAFIPYPNRQFTAKKLTAADFIRVDALVRT
ncbi:MAG: hypothetical protein ETSY2_33835 [Candidatus Entotheonella gemina]|uniref:Uncharacterized protein n=1 Tax=Candidatus Entotheonella gemina TaxID=1429439 RepID=W4M009_9BACT|nr:MAG: hypothetical protein ETSY2_33835 [Candidatus Entotheonella gemina]